MKENAYQAGLIKRIKRLLPGCFVLKNDANYIQGIPDLTVVYRGRCVVLEVKASEKSKDRPNQKYYISTLSENDTPAWIIYPENEEEVLRELKLALQ